jgi:outer membrane protein assembly factor BamB
LRRTVFVLSALWVLSPCLFAENWPEFRGPTGEGHANGALPTEWGPDKNIAWKQAIPGKGWSSPIVYDGRVYLTTAVPVAGEQSLQALCLDAASGKKLWEREVFVQPKTAPRIQNKNSHASPTPITDGQRLYVHFGHMGAAALDLSGNILWHNTELKYAPVHGNGGSPILVDDKLIFSCDGGDTRFVAALNKATGKLLWKTERDVPVVKGFSFHTPLLITVNGRRQVISAGSGIISAFDPANGKEIWRVRHNGYSVIPRPVFGHGLVFISTGYDAASLLAIRPDGRGDVTSTHVVWQLRKAAPHTPSPLLVGAELFTVADNGTATCLDARTGKVHWQERLGGNFSASPIDADGKIYFQNEEGVGAVVKVGTQFELLAKNDLQERTLASYAAAEGAILLRSEKHLFCIR